MNVKGVCYDVGRVMFGNWRPDYNPRTVRRELEIIKHDLHCNAVRICGLDIGRLMTTAEDALEQGLNVWLSPEMWDQSQDKTIDYIARAAVAAETLRRRYPDRLVFSVGDELTLFMPGIVKGRSVMKRLGNPSLWDDIRAGRHNQPLNEFLAMANQAVRQVFHGQVTYISLVWEAVNWSLFDIVSVDHYRATSIQDRYAEMLKPLFGHGKPVVVTEFGCCTYRGAEVNTGRAWGIVDIKSEILHRVPVVGRFVKRRLKGQYVRDEALQAREIVDQLEVLDKAGVEGTFVMTFVAPNNPYDENPRYDLDMASYSLVRSYPDRKYGATYPDMNWEPKESFQGVADYYAGTSDSR